MLGVWVFWLLTSGLSARVVSGPGILTRISSGVSPGILARISSGVSSGISPGVSSGVSACVGTAFFQHAEGQSVGAPVPVEEHELMLSRLQCWHQKGHTLGAACITNGPARRAFPAVATVALFAAGVTGFTSLAGHLGDGSPETAQEQRGVDSVGEWPTGHDGAVPWEPYRRRGGLQLDQTTGGGRTGARLTGKEQGGECKPQHQKSVIRRSSVDF